jgi:hypothetical protein
MMNALRSSLTSEKQQIPSDSNNYNPLRQSKVLSPPKPPEINNEQSEFRQEIINRKYQW